MPAPTIHHLDPAAVTDALGLRDLTDPAAGPHAVAVMTELVVSTLTRCWSTNLVLDRGQRIVDVADNYDRLGYRGDAVTRDARYSRYLTDTTMLRTQTSALVPAALRALASATVGDELVACPGVVWRRDVIDRLHTGTPHQMDLWRVRAGAPLGVADLEQMIDLVVEAALPGAEWRSTPAIHPYTTDGLEVEARAGQQWVEIAECGLAAPGVLAGAGLGPDVTGLAMGLGLDRLVMLRKGIDDIRLLRSDDPRVVVQLRDLEPYRPVSAYPAARRDVSVAMTGDVDDETLGDVIREGLGADADLVEQVHVLSVTEADALTRSAAERLVIRPGERNVLVRVVLRDLRTTLTAEAANRLRDRIYGLLHHRDDSAAPDGRV